MQASQTPILIPLPWANSGTKNPIPLASQVGIKDGAASLTTGFPPITFTPLAAGGVAPDGADFNGAFNLITQFQVCQSAGMPVQYDSAFSTLVGGYPAGAIVRTSDGKMWRNRTDNNNTVPGSAGWVSATGPQHAAPFAVSASAQLSAAQAIGNLILISGATAPITLTLPPSANCDNGANVSFLNATGFAVTIAASANEFINPAASAIASVVLQAGDSLTISLFKDAVNWEVIGGTAQLTYAPTFSSSLSGNGFKKLGNVIIQWGSAVTDGSGSVTVGFPIAFPTQLFSVIAVPTNSTGNYSISAYSGSQIGVQIKSTVSGTPAATTFSYIAIGR